MYIELAGDEVAVAMRVGHFRHLSMTCKMLAKEDIYDSKDKQKWLDVASCIDEQIKGSKSKALSYDD